MFIHSHPYFLYLVVQSTENEQGIFEEVLHGELDFTSDPWPSISEGAKDLVRRMLLRDPRKRISAHDVLCESPFFFCFFFVLKTLM